MIQEFNQIVQIKRHMITAYSPCVNGTVENVNNDFGKLLRSLTSEWMLESSQYPLLIPLVQSVLNHLLSSSRAGYASLTIMTGLPVHNPLTRVFEPDANRFVKSPMTIDRLKEHMIELR